MNSNRQSDILKIISDWSELIDDAQINGIAGEAIDYNLFRHCIKSAFEWLLLDKKPKNQFDRFETYLYAEIFAYSQIPAVTLSENSRLFETSLYLAEN